MNFPCKHASCRSLETKLVISFPSTVSKPIKKGNTNLHSLITVMCSQSVALHLPCQHWKPDRSWTGMDWLHWVCLWRRERSLQQHHNNSTQYILCMKQQWENKLKSLSAQGGGSSLKHPRLSCTENWQMNKFHQLVNWGTKKAHLNECIKKGTLQICTHRHRHSKIETTSQLQNRTKAKS